MGGTALAGQGTGPLNGGGLRRVDRHQRCQQVLGLHVGAAIRTLLAAEVLEHLRRPNTA